MGKVASEKQAHAEPGTVAVAVRLLRTCLSGEGWRTLLGYLLLLAGTGVALLQPWPLKLMVDVVVGDEAAPGFLQRLLDRFGEGASTGALLAVLCASILLLHLISGALNVGSTYVLTSAGLRMVFKLRSRVFDRLQRLSLSFHDHHAVGDSLYRVTWDTYCVQTLFQNGLVSLMTALATLLGIGWIMWLLDSRIALSALAVAVPLGWLITRLDRPMSQGSMRVHESESAVSARVQETMSGIRAVQAFGQERREQKRFQNQADESLRAMLRLTLVESGSQALVGSLLAAGTATVIWLAASSAVRGELTAGDVVLAAAYVAMLYKPLETLAYTATTVQGASAGARRVFEILDCKLQIVDAPTATPLMERARGAITLESVAFEYEEGVPALRGVSASIRAGSCVALVGASGAGKTTLASLLLRFYDPTSGTISLDGRDLRSITLNSLRESVAFVPQEPVLFGTSLRENIAYGRPGASTEEIEAAARAAGAHGFIQDLPEGYETVLGERGVTLSGGERQRISIARAFLRDAPVLILDEPTSALDAETEVDLLQQLSRLKQGRTTIIIAHRLSTIRDADWIIALKDGKVVEQGTFAELLAKRGYFYRLRTAQAVPGESLAGPSPADGLELARG